MTNTQHDRMPNVVEVCADEAQMLALSITRFLAAGYMTQDVPAGTRDANAPKRCSGLGPPPASSQP